MRDQITLSNDEIEAAFAEAFDTTVCADPEYGVDLVFTAETLADFEAATAKYHSHGAIFRNGNALEIQAVQVTPGAPRRDVRVIDFGAVRAVSA